MRRVIVFQERQPEVSLVVGDDAHVVGEFRWLGRDAQDPPVPSRLFGSAEDLPPFLVELWRRLGRDVATAPRSPAQAAEALA